MTKARDLANIISGGFTADDIPNIDASKITSGTFDASKIGSGTFADARISQSSVSQHATSFDDNKIVNDLSTLALRQASDQNKSAYSTGSSSVDVFQDDTGIDTITNSKRLSSEFVASIYNLTLNFDPSFVQIQNNSPIETGFWTGAVTNGSAYNSGSPNYTNVMIDYGFPLGQDFTTNVFTVNSSGSRDAGMDYPAQSIFVTTNTDYQDASPSGFIGSAHSNNHYGNLTRSNWQEHMSSTAITATGIASGGEVNVIGTGTINQDIANGTYVARHYLNNGSVYWGYKWTYTASTNTLTGEYRNNGTTGVTGSGKITLTNVPSTGTVFFVVGEASGGGRYWSTNANGYLNQSSVKQVGNSATGNFTGTTITAPSSVSEMGAIITYQDNAGTNALNTDIVLQLSADGGSNYSTATLTALPDFSTGIKMAKVNDLAVTAGTQLKYKISFANQASGSKEARIRGVALQY